MSRSPPPPSSRSWYPPQGSASGPPPMPSKPAERRSPGYDRGHPAEWYRWHEYYRGHSPSRHSPTRGAPRAHSPLKSGTVPRDPAMRAPSPHERTSSRRSPSPRKDRPPSPRSDLPGQRPRSPRSDNRPPSPRRERPRSPWEWRRRSPVPVAYPPPPREWRKRSRSPPPHWVRRSPPRYGPPRGRSPPRGGWGPPPPEWDRYRGPPPPGRHSPPRWGPPPPPRSWDHRWEPPAGPGYRRPSPGRQQPTLPPSHAPSTPSSEFYKNDSNNKAVLTKGVDGVIPPGEEKEEVIDDFDLPEYSAEVPLGQKYVIAVSGFFCKVCHKFYNSEASAKITHCKSRAHYDKFSKWLSEKQVAALMKKREAASAGATDEQRDVDDSEPPAKQIKLEPVEVKEEPQPVPPPSEGTYDPSQPTEDDSPAKLLVDQTDKPDESAKQETNASVEQMEEETTTPDQNGQVGQSNDSDSEALITNDTKKDDDGFVEATLYNLRKMRVNQLKANLEKRGLKSTGLKTLLLKRLEKVLLEEAAASNEAEQEESAEKDTAIVDDGANGAPSEANDHNSRLYVMKLHESDIELANRKTQWITERELARELEQIEGVIKVERVSQEKSKLGRKTVVEWTVSLKYDGELPEDGLFFTMPSHQQLPYKAEVADPSDECSADFSLL